MSRVYYNWERFVEAVLKREDLRQLALCESFSSSILADFNSRFSFDSSLEDVCSASRISSDTVNPGALSSMNSLSNREAQRIRFEEIKRATKYSRRDLIIGERGFGTAHKGWIDDGTLTASKPGSGMSVAIKKWNLNNPPFMDWNQHYLQGREKWMSVPWEIRIKVAISAARALSFLHDRKIQVIHWGFKSEDVLLDGEFNAKLSDFSLARDGPTGDMTHVSTRIMGTYGYAAPEYIATGHLTAKCDVYGFGVVLLELLSGRRAVDMNRAREEQKLVEWAKPYLCDKRKLLRIMDSKLEGQYTREAAYSVATLASRCLRLEPKRRPRMAEVLVALEQL